MSESFDVIVVGARCAGASLATMLARAGLRVCLVDKDRFPSDTLSTHGIQPAGVQVLERIGVLETLLGLAPALVRLRGFFDDAVVVFDDVIAFAGAPASASAGSRSTRSSSTPRLRRAPRSERRPRSAAWSSTAIASPASRRPRAS